MVRVIRKALRARQPISVDSVIVHVNNAQMQERRGSNNMAYTGIGKLTKEKAAAARAAGYSKTRATRSDKGVSKKTKQRRPY